MAIETVGPGSLATVPPSPPPPPAPPPPSAPLSPALAEMDSARTCPPGRCQISVSQTRGPDGPHHRKIWTPLNAVLRQAAPAWLSSASAVRSEAVLLTAGPRRATGDAGSD